MLLIKRSVDWRHIDTQLLYFDMQTNWPTFDYRKLSNQSYTFILSLIILYHDNNTTSNYCLINNYCS
jgi:hypothetical protein